MICLFLYTKWLSFVLKKFLLKILKEILSTFSISYEINHLYLNICNGIRWIQAICFMINSNENNSYTHTVFVNFCSSDIAVEYDKL